MNKKQIQLAQVLTKFIVDKQELFDIKAKVSPVAIANTFDNCLKSSLSHKQEGLSDGQPTSIFDIDTVIDYLHDSLNTGHWSQVPIYIRQAFALSNFIKCLLLLETEPEYNVGLLKTCLKCIDLGILLGAPLEANADLLTDSAKYLSCEISEISNDNNLKIAPSKRKIDNSFEEINAKEIPTENRLSLERFNANFFVPQKPVKLTGCMTHWAACKKWSDVNYLTKIAGDRTVPIEIGSHYVDENWSQKLMTLKEFITRHYLSDDGQIGYLAQHNLFEQITELKEDIHIPEYCTLSSDYEHSTEPDINAWFGPKGTVSPLHQDPKNNILAQVHGTKQLILFSPRDSRYLYPHEGKLLSNTAQVDPLKPDLARHADFPKAEMFKCLLEPGDMIFIPVKWWHHVTALDKSFSVSFWWQ